MTRAVLLIDHGSRRADAHEGLMNAARQLEQRFVDLGSELIVEIAHMEIAEPTIAEGYRRCAARGASRITAVPCFLSRGRHVTEDVPALLAEVAREFPELQFNISPPLLEVPGFISMLADHIGDL